jgi:cytochrome c oxidase assembly factor CtaG
VAGGSADRRIQSRVEWHVGRSNRSFAKGQHLLLMTIAPPLIWLGSPVVAVWNGLPRLARNAVLPVIQQPVAARIGRAMTRPVFCWMAAAAALVLWHVPSVFELGMESERWHAIEQASFLATGLLFWWPVIGSFTTASAESWTILVYLFLATLPCDVLSGLLVFSDRVAYPVYLCRPQRAGFAALEDQQCAGALMWTCVTVVYLAAGTILAIRLLSPRNDARICNSASDPPFPGATWHGVGLEPLVPFSSPNPGRELSHKASEVVGRLRHGVAAKQKVPVPAK